MNNIQWCITGETFGSKFLKEDFQAIYNQTASNFKR